MDYEKLYNEALEAARQGKSIEQIFPELAESEDEKIRKAILLFFQTQDDNTTYSFIPKKDIISWLEKQKDIIEEYEDKLDRCACENFDKGYKACLENQSEWSEEDTLHLTNAILSAEKEWGVESCTAKWLKSLKPQPKQEWNDEDDSIRKELIEFIKEGKYYCCPSSEKRQKWAHWLEKQKPIEQNDYDRGYRDGVSAAEFNNKWSEEDEKCRNALINICSYPHDEMDGRPWDKWINWLKSLKPQSTQEWDEKEESILNDIIHSGEHNCLLTIEQVDWLKSLKSQLKQEWSKDGERHYKGCLAFFKGIGTCSPYYQDYLWLKSLQVKTTNSKLEQKWNEEDKKMLESTLLFIDEHRDKHPLARKCYDWLKSLKSH